ncbi:membrane protein PM19L-like [Diospyros lotus]|uniref:membrane protein PM19L-like n=1 Tax=Diospyros lotus TaxID=55363 RepID=UPI00224E0360|nr:membrane protein PM19L-like [Diospyros lotus]
MAKFERTAAAPLLALNFVLYVVLLGFASWCLNRYIDGANHHLGGNGATVLLLTFAILAAVVGIAAKVAAGNHARTWKAEHISAAVATELVAWAITALAFGFACKEIHIGGHRGWRLKVVEAFTIILTFTQLLYLLFIHALD